MTTITLAQSLAFSKTHFNTLDEMLHFMLEKVSGKLEIEDFTKEEKDLFEKRGKDIVQLEREISSLV